MPRLRYWIVMYLVMTAAMLSGIYIGGRLLISHETALIQTAMGLQPDQPGNKSTAAAPTTTDEDE